MSCSGSVNNSHLDRQEGNILLTRGRFSRFSPVKTSRILTVTAKHSWKKNRAKIYANCYKTMKHNSQRNLVIMKCQVMTLEFIQLGGYCDVDIIIIFYKYSSIKRCHY